MEEVRRFEPGLVVLDIMLPRLDGAGVLKRLRQEGSRVPVIMLTARDATIDKVHSLDLGADDYVTKAFEIDELPACIRALLRRTEGEDILRVADLEVNTATREVRRGEVTTSSGSFEAGVDGAQAGIIMLADPKDGMTYRQEYYEGEAEDKAEVLSTEEQVEVPFGHFEGALLTKDLVPLEPKVSEYKLYARGVGPVLTVKTSGGSGREELVSYSQAG